MEKTVCVLAWQGVSDEYYLIYVAGDGEFPYYELCSLSGKAPMPVGTTWGSMYLGDAYATCALLNAVIKFGKGRS